MSSNQEKSLDAEVNLIPFISLLSMLICTLLLTAVWIQIGSMDVKQSVGAEGKDAGASQESTLWAFVDEKGQIELKLENAPANLPKSLRKISIQATNEGAPNYDLLTAKLVEIKKADPKLAIALIQPKGNTEYDHIIQLMDRLKNESINDLGVVPL